MEALFGGTPEEKPQVYAASSPLTCADAPLCLPCREQTIKFCYVEVLLLAELGAVSDHPLVRGACEFTLETIQRSDGAFPGRHPVYGDVRPCAQGLVTEALLWLTSDPSSSQKPPGVVK